MNLVALRFDIVADRCCIMIFSLLGWSHCGSLSFTHLLSPASEMLCADTLPKETLKARVIHI